MKLSTSFLPVLTAICANVARSAVIDIHARGDIYSPPVILPKEADTWRIGETQRVAWDLSDVSPPGDASDSNGVLDLSAEIRLRNDDFEIPNLVLAKGFSILDGEVNVTVPNVEPGDVYSVILVTAKVAGNTSPFFSIVN